MLVQGLRRVRVRVRVPPALSLLVLVLTLSVLAVQAGQSVRRASASASVSTDGFSNGTNGTNDSAGALGKKVTKRFHLFVFDFERVGSLFSVGVFMLIVAISRMLFHLHPKLPSYVPESCLLIVLGVIAGIFVYFVGGRSVHLDPDTFFLLLLPPIVLDAGFFMNTRALFDNMGTVALFAGVGTLFNTLAIGFSLHFCSQNMLGLIQIDIRLLEALLFASLIAAVDPVAVLALFEEIHVNEELYIIVFGESLFNDAVSVVLFNMFYKLNEIEMNSSIILTDYIYGAVSLVTVGFFGSMVGVLMGLAVAFVTRFTDHIRVLEPVYAFLMTYIAYLLAEMFHWSGILAAVFCGMVMKQYVPANMSRKSYTTVKYFLKMASSMCESLVFMYMGLTTVNDSHQFTLVNFSFIGFTLVFCLLFRVIGVIMLANVANMFRIVRLSFVDQFVMSYGGLRGAVAISLAMLVNGDVVPHRDLFTTCAIAVVYFTVFVQGFTIKPLVTWLNVKRDEKREISMNAQLHLRVIDHAMVGIEDIIGVKGHNRLRHFLDQFNYRYLQRILLREQPQTRESALIQVVSKLNIKHAVEYIEQHGSLDAYGSGMHLNPSASNLHLLNRSPETDNVTPRGIRLGNVSEEGDASNSRSRSNEHDAVEDQGITFHASPKQRRFKTVPKISIDSSQTSAASKWRPLADASHMSGPTEATESEEGQTQSAKLNWKRLRTAAKFKVIIAQAALDEHEKVSPTNSVSFRPNVARRDSNTSTESARFLRNTLKAAKSPQTPFIHARSLQVVEQDEVAHHAARTAFLRAVNELHMLSRNRTNASKFARMSERATRPSRARHVSEKESTSSPRPLASAEALSHSLERLSEGAEGEHDGASLVQAATRPKRSEECAAPAERSVENVRVVHTLPKPKSFDDSESETFYSCMSVNSSTFNDPNALNSLQLRTPPTAIRAGQQQEVIIAPSSRGGILKHSDMATLVEIDTDESDVASCESQVSTSNGQPKPFRRDYIPPCNLAKGDHETLL